MSGNETAIAAGRIDQAITRASYRPSQERRDDDIGRVVGAGLLLQQSLAHSPTARQRIVFAEGAV